MAKKKITKKKMAPQKKGGLAKKMGVAAGVAAALVGGYLLYHQSSPAQKRKAKAWVVKVRKEAAREVGKLKHVSAPEYARIVDQVMQRYASLKDASAPELIQAASDLKSEWKHIQAAATKGMKAAAKPTSKKKSVTKRKAR
jgi:Na+/H+-translocating membrane pyrophosphatase